MTLLLVMIGAAVGAPSRWLLDQRIQSSHDSVFPWGTLTINVVGSLLLGFILGAVSLGHGSSELAALAGTGFCGGFTTFSTFGYETIRLVEDGSARQAGRNVLASLVLGMIAALAGWYLTQSIWA
ncbi:MAG: fluoride efflux transporter CrcB [Candidatus Nanopelagicales bacterium]